jgi:hypothetical protein
MAGSGSPEDAIVLRNLVLRELVARRQGRDEKGIVLSGPVP